MPLDLSEMSHDAVRASASRWISVPPQRKSSFFVHFGWECPEMQRAPGEAKCKLGAFLVKIWSVCAFLSVLESST